MKLGNVNIDFETTRIVQIFVGACLIIPAIVGVVISVVFNGHEYFVLSQGGCGASFVGGRWGYLDLQFVSWGMKVSSLLGLTL